MGGEKLELLFIEGGYLKEVYNKYKNLYENYIIIFKNGNFYVSLNKDAFIMSNIFSYKLVESKNIIKIGFPFNSIDKVINKLNLLEINYIVIDKEIIIKKIFNNNNYLEYVNNNDLLKINKINRINEILKSNIKHKNIDYILEEIEKLVCTINY